MAGKKPTHVICHPSFYLRGAKGKLEQQEEGKELVLSKSQGESMEKKGFVKPVSDDKAQDLSDGDDLKKAEKMFSEAKELMADAEKLKGKSTKELAEAKTIAGDAEKLEDVSSSELESAKELMGDAEKMKGESAKELSDAKELMGDAEKMMAAAEKLSKKSKKKD